MCAMLLAQGPGLRVPAAGFCSVDPHVLHGCTAALAIGTNFVAGACVGEGWQHRRMVALNKIGWGAFELGPAIVLLFCSPIWVGSFIWHSSYSAVL